MCARIPCYIPPMLPLITELIRHKWWANSNLLRSVQQHPQAAEDPELRKLLHHILIANRYWLLLSLGEPFIDEEETRIPDSHLALIDRFSATERQEMAWLASLAPADLDRPLQPRALPDLTVTVAQAAMQVILHSQGHRSQCATRLRALGGTPAPMDFVLWVREQRTQSN
jgi:uncharacterized damage-inducible protein DinB